VSLYIPFTLSSDRLIFTCIFWSFLYIHTRAILHSRCRILVYTELLYWAKFSTVQ
jgi:hypothetical protein